MNRQALSNPSLPWVKEGRQAEPEELGLGIDFFRRKLCSLATRLLPRDLRSKADAEDLVQETFLESIRTFARFTGATEDDLFVWLRGILRHRLANFRTSFQTKKRQVVQELSLADSTLVGFPEPPGREPSPDFYLLHDQEINRPLTIAFLSLPPGGDLELILYHHYEKYRSLAETARIMGISRTAASRLWSAALAYLKSYCQPRTV